MCIEKVLRIFLLAIVLFIGQSVYAQKVALGLNLPALVDMGTIEGMLDISAGRRVTIGASVQYNPWTFKKGTSEQKCWNTRSVSLDFRYWPWHIHSGWWILAKGQISEFNKFGFWGKKENEQGHMYGGGIGCGYSLMIGKHWNVDFGASLWMGRKKSKFYSCSSCGYPLRTYDGFFISPDRLFVTLYYMF